MRMIYRPTKTKQVIHNIMIRRLIIMEQFSRSDHIACSELYCWPVASGTLEIALGLYYHYN